MTDKKFNIHFEVKGAVPNKPFAITVSGPRSDSNTSSFISSISDYIKITSPKITVTSIACSDVTTETPVRSTDSDLGSTTIIIGSDGTGAGSVDVTTLISGDSFAFIINGASATFENTSQATAELQNKISALTLFATSLVFSLLCFLLYRDFREKNTNDLIGKHYK